MKEFFKFTLASALGTLLALFLSLFIFFVMVIILISLVQFDKPETVSSKTILEIKLDYQVPERTLDNPLSDFSFGSFSLKTPLGLNNIIASIRKAKDDKNIEGIYLNLNNFNAGGIATLEAIRNELSEFKKSGKFIIAFGANIGQRAYYLASICDKIYISPIGSLDFRGLAVEMVFFKNTLAKLDIDVQIFQYGKYKSATEPFRLDKMSEENRLQTTELIRSFHSFMIGKISKSRNISVEELDNISANLLVQNANEAYKYKLVDSLIYEDQLIDFLKEKARIGKEDKLKTISIQEYDKTKGEGNSSKNRIAVIYAVGEIGSGKGDDESIGIENISKAIRTARQDDDIKAIVMRVNSPGGDAITSDLIWREVELARKSKPFIVSMGDVAASGGYYISCAADTIVAEPYTITGSIGVFGMIPNMQKFFNSKLGITFDRVKTGKYSDIFTTTRPLTPEEKNIFQKDVDRIYETFVKKASDGRHLKYEQVHEIAQGRIWTGLQAKENGLVDLIGGLNDAIKIAAAKAKLKDYVVVEYPALKQLFDAIFNDLSNDAKSAYLKKQLGENYKYYNYLKQVENCSGLQARMPFQMDIY